MTRISEIHGPGIPVNEFADRGMNVPKPSYVPYLSMTKGEMQIALAAQRANMLAKWYGSDAKEFQQAANMLSNSLQTGLHYTGAFVGAIPDVLQPTARLIQSAKYRTSPASSAMFYRPKGMAGIGEIIPAEQRRLECIKAGGFTPANVAKCTRNFNIEQIYNGAIEKCGHHVIYHKINKMYRMPDRVYTKLLLQTSGIQGMAAVSHLDNSLMGEWVENGIMAKNASLNLGPATSLESSFSLAPDPQQAYAKYISAYPSAAKWSSVSGINALPAAAAIIGAIVSALIAAKGLIEALRKQQATIKAEGFGTEAYSGDPSDFLGGEVDKGQEFLIYALLGGAAIYFLSNK